MPPTDTSTGELATAFDTILALIKQRDCNLTQLAAQAGVSYQSLYNWVNGRTKSYNLLDGERVYFALTGKTFIGGWEV